MVDIQGCKLRDMSGSFVVYFTYYYLPRLVHGVCEFEPKYDVVDATQITYLTQ